MRGNSRHVTSSQTDVHRHLPKVVAIHCSTQWLGPVHPRSELMLKELLDWHIRLGSPPLVLDSGCGTGASFAWLAARHPDAAIVGVDQSVARLERCTMSPDIADRCLALRGDCLDLWQLLAARGMSLSYHYLLYPNPWPKPRHLKRRWHGHPLFSTMLRLANVLHLRTNWKIYSEEFVTAVRHVLPAASITCFTPEDIATLFEQKYVESGHCRYGVEVVMGERECGEGESEQAGGGIRTLYGNGLP